MSPNERMALIQKMHGSKRPAPQEGPHFCTSTSKTAKATAPMPPAMKVMIRFRGGFSASLRLRQVIPKTLKKAAIHNFTPTASPIKKGVRKATKITLRPNTGTATETSPFSKARNCESCPTKRHMAMMPGCHSSSFSTGGPPSNQSNENRAATMRFATKVVRHKPTPRSLERFNTSAPKA